MQLDFDGHAQHYKYRDLGVTVPTRLASHFMSLLQNNSPDAVSAVANADTTVADRCRHGRQPVAAAPTRTARVLLTANASGEQLANGGVVQVASLGWIGRNAIVKKVTATAFNTDRIGRAGVGQAGRRQRRAHQRQRAQRLGWLEHDAESFGERPSESFARSGHDAVGDVAHEDAAVLAQQIANENLVERYGSVDADKLHEGIVPFPGHDYYYLDKDHVVADVISRNWDKLGLDPSSERAREGKWLKVQRSVVDVCLDQLKSNVLTKLPKTDLQNGLAVHFAADKNASNELVAGAQYPISCELLVEYTVPGAATQQQAVPGVEE